MFHYWLQRLPPHPTPTPPLPHPSPHPSPLGAAAPFTATMKCVPVHLLKTRFITALICTDGQRELPPARRRRRHRSTKIRLMTRFIFGCCKRSRSFTTLTPPRGGRMLQQDCSRTCTGGTQPHTHTPPDYHTCEDSHQHAACVLTPQKCPHFASEMVLVTQTLNLQKKKIVHGFSGILKFNHQIKDESAGRLR